MASGVTYQALERLTNMPERSGEQGDRIAAQFYYDIYITGGSAANLILTNATINGLIYGPTSKNISGGGSFTLLSTDNIVYVDTTTGATTLNLPASPSTNQYLIIKDTAGLANSHNITISGNGHTIDGASSEVIGAPYGWLVLAKNSTQWSIVG